MPLWSKLILLRGKVPSSIELQKKDALQAGHIERFGTRFRRMLSRRGVFFLHQTLLAPILANEDDSRREYILNVILLGSVILNGALAVSVMYDAFRQSGYLGIASGPFFIFFLTFLLLYVLSRKGHYKIASYILVVLYFAGTTYTMARWGPDLPVVLIAYSLLIVISSVLVGTRFGFLVAGMIMVTVFAIGYLQTHGAITVAKAWRLQPFKVFRDGFVYTLLIFLIGVISWLSNRETERSLLRARQSEAALKRERDMLEIKVEERTQELKRIQLEEISKIYRFVEFGRLASGIFHDLMTPLSAIAIHIQQMDIAEPKEIAQAKTAMDRAIVDTRRIEKFIQAMRRHMSRQETRIRFDVAEEIEYVIELFRHKAKLADVQLSFTNPGPLFTISDPLKFQQMVANLISNAIDAYDGAVPEKNPRQVSITLKKEQVTVLLQIRDWGQGIPAEMLPKIFEPFFTTKDISKGTGIGLSTTKYLVEKELQGTIVVASEPNSGATFTIRFPANDHESTYH